MFAILVIHDAKVALVSQQHAGAEHGCLWNERSHPKVKATPDPAGHAASSPGGLVRKSKKENDRRGSLFQQ
jgi:hypothetical protein